MVDIIINKIYRYVDIKHTTEKYKILHAPIVEYQSEEYDDLLYKQTENRAKESDKITISKSVFLETFGMSNVNEEFINIYYKQDYKFKNLLSIIDEEFKINNNHIKEPFIDILHRLGFDNVFDTKKLIKNHKNVNNKDKLSFEKIKPIILQESIFFKNIKDYYLAFNLNKNYIDNLNKLTNKQILYIINVIFSNFSIKLSYYANECSYYKLEYLKGINELVKNKIITGYIKNIKNIIIPESNIWTNMLDIRHLDIKKENYYNKYKENYEDLLFDIE